MESVLLGMAAPAVAGTAGSLVERTVQTVAEPFAALLHALGAALAEGDDDTARVAVEGQPDQLKTLSAELAARIEKALKSAGIELAGPIGLRMSPVDGHLEVDGDHPQQALIEAALADDPEIASAIREVAALQQVLDSTRSAEVMAEAATAEFGKFDGSISARFSPSAEGAMLLFD
jgi:hypothetical protein